MIKKSKTIQKQKKNQFIPRTLSFNFNIALLGVKYSDVEPLIHQNYYGMPTINFKDQKALSIFNRRVMQEYFGILDFLLPQDVMQPCLGGRLNYIDWVKCNLIKHQQNVVLIDIGCGYSAIYALLGYAKYRWQGIVVDSNSAALENVQNIIQANNITQIQLVNGNLFEGCRSIIPQQSTIISMCNPPFYDVSEIRLETNRPITTEENQCNGGEVKFIKNMYEKSKQEEYIGWFSTLIGRKNDYETLVTYFSHLDVDIVTGKLYQGKNVRWVIAWKFN